MTGQQFEIENGGTAGSNKPTLMGVVAASRDYPVTMAAAIAKLEHMAGALDVAFFPSHCRVDADGFWMTVGTDLDDELWTFRVPVADTRPGGEALH